ncbi:MAG: flagellar biosynthetic protein FliO [Deltaproteobacteria bacterium]|nr:flagellar biosynthetic protein FliO [Deltaproteobacteria bacterium]
MNILIVYSLVVSMAGAPKDVIESAIFSETAESIILTIKTRNKAEPNAEKWWYGGKFRIRVRNARFSKNFIQKSHQDLHKKIKIENKYYDDYGAVFRLGFQAKQKELENSLKVLFKTGEISMSVSKKSLGITTGGEVVEAVVGKGDSGDKKSVVLAGVDSIPDTDATEDKKVETEPSSSKKQMSSPVKEPEKTLTGKGKLGEEVISNLRKSGGSKKGGKSSTTGGFTTTFLLLLLMTLLGGGSYYYLKRKQKLPQGLKGSSIRLIEQKMIMPGAKLAVVQVNDRVLVIGITSGNMTLLTEFIPEYSGIKEEEMFDEEDNDATPESVKGILELREKFLKQQSDDLKASEVEGTFNQAAGLESYKRNK